jgi:magnesium chelatase subunit D
MRGDLVLARTARAHAAWSGRDTVNGEDVRVAARFALPHRRRRDPFDAPGIDDEALEQALRDAAPEDPEDPSDPDGGPGGSGGPYGSSGPDGSGGSDRSGDASDGAGSDGSGSGSESEPPTGRAASEPLAQSRGEGDESSPSEPGSAQTDGQRAETQTPVRPPSPGTRTDASGGTFRVRPLRVPGLGQGAAGRRSRAITPAGRTIATRPVGDASGAGATLRSVHLPSTLLAAAPHQRARGRDGAGRLLLRSSGRARRATSSCSASTRPDRWPPVSG